MSDFSKFPKTGLAWDLVRFYSSILLCSADTYYDEWEAVRIMGGCFID